MPRPVGAAEVFCLQLAGNRCGSRADLWQWEERIILAPAFVYGLAWLLCRGLPSIKGGEICLAPDLKQKSERVYADFVDGLSIWPAVCARKQADWLE